LRLDHGFRSAILLFTFLSLLDVATTHLALRAGMVEANWIPSMLLIVGGEPAMYLFKVVATLAVVVTVAGFGPHFRRLRFGLKAANLLLGLVVISNTLQLLVA